MTKNFTKFLTVVCALSVTALAKADFTPVELQLTSTMEGDHTHDDVTYGICFGYSAVIANNQAFVGAGASATVGADKGSHTVYVYDINEDGTTTLTQKIVEPETTNFFGWAVAASDDYLAIYATSTKNIYIYAKDASGLWTDQPVTTIGSITAFYFAIDGDRLVTVENAHVCVEKIVKDENGEYSVVRETIAEGDWKVDDENAIKIASNAGVAISGNALAINVKNDGVYIFEYTESGWAQTNKVTHTATANRATSIAMNDKYISVAPGGTEFIVIEKAEDGWANATVSTITTKYITKAYTTAINGNFIAVTQMNGAATAHGDYYAEFYTKVNGTWTLVKYAAQLDVDGGIAMDIDFDGKYFLASTQSIKINGTNNVGQAYLYKFVSDINYEQSEAESVVETEVAQAPSNVVSVADEYNATITYSLVEDGTYTTDIPELSAAGIYTIYYTIEAEGYNTATGSVDFTITETQSITTAISNENSTEVKVYTEGSHIAVENAENKNISIYNIAGTRIYSATADAKATISVGNAGIYIVEVEGKAYKVVVR